MYTRPLVQLNINTVQNMNLTQEKNKVTELKSLKQQANSELPPR